MGRVLTKIISAMKVLCLLPLLLAVASPKAVRRGEKQGSTGFPWYSSTGFPSYGSGSFPSYSTGFPWYGSGSGSFSGYDYNGSGSFSVYGRKSLERLGSGSFSG